MPVKTEPRPFGDYLQKNISDHNSPVAKRLHSLYRAMGTATSMSGLTKAVCSISEYVDRDHLSVRRLIGTGTQAFSNFRGNFLEEVTQRIARLAVIKCGMGKKLEVVKLATGTGVVTGLSLYFRSGNVPDPVPMRLRRDREDVIVGLRRSLLIRNEQGEEIAFHGEIVPICVIACKVYIDATRLENVLAKARNMHVQYAASQFLVVAEWDALGAKDWHGNDDGPVLDSLISPVRRIVFLRGPKNVRPGNKQLEVASAANPYSPERRSEVYEAVVKAIQEWSNG